MTIYIDVVIIENVIMNFIILYATGIILKIKIKKLRLLISSLLGAIYSVIAYMSILEVYSNIILKFILSIIIVYIAFFPQNVKQMCKSLLIFYLTSFIFGGAAFSLIYIIKPQDILMKNGMFLGMYPIKTIIIATIIAFILTMLSFKIVKNKISKKDMFCDLEITIFKKTLSAHAMVDTGNFLKEPITNTPVIVVEHTLLYNYIPKEILNNLEEILGGDLEEIPEIIRNEYISKLKLIPFSSLGKQNGMLVGIKAEKVKIIKNDINIEKNNIILGMYNKSLTKKGEYRALIGIELI